MTGDLQVPGGPLIPARELHWRYSASGGPGGQHANTSNTRAEVFFDASSSEALSQAQRQLVTARLGPLVRVVASDQRSQWQNRQLAMGRIAEALEVVPDRRPTAPSRRELSRRRQMRQHEQKRRQLRRWTYGGED